MAMVDVLVIGSGMAGAMAALSAKALGASVGVASRSYGATALSTGGLDIAFNPALSPALQEPRTLAEHVMDLIAHRPQHPYNIMGLEMSLRGLRHGYEHLREALCLSGLAPKPLSLEDENQGLPSSLGTIIPAGAVLSPHRGIDFNQPVAGRWGVLEFLGEPFFDAGRVAQGLAVDAQALTGVTPELVPVRIGFAERMGPFGLAAVLDAPEGVDRLAATLKGKLDGFCGLLVPPVLGLDAASRSRQRLADQLAVPVIESLAHMPSVPGLRLQRALHAALESRGIESFGEITATRQNGTDLSAVVTRDSSRIAAGAFVLATGRYIAGGVVWDERRCREALFNLPVVSALGPIEAESPHSVVRDTPVESHPLLTAGVAIDGDLRPRKEGRVAFANLFAAGMVIGGFASRYALCADGVAIATGYEAGAAAAACAGGRHG
jgi:glycerol-3-phosphate dehydrogenase subunit B